MRQVCFGLVFLIKDQNKFLLLSTKPGLFPDIPLYVKKLIFQSATKREKGLVSCLAFMDLTVQPSDTTKRLNNV